MANCPKCGIRLRIYHLSQYCPKCKTNLCFYDFEKNFLREAKIAELTQASMSARISRLKAAFIGSKLVIARLVMMLLPILGLLISAGSFVLTLPFKQTSFDLSGIGVFGILSGSDFSYILQMCGAPVGGSEFLAVRNALLMYLVPAIFAVGVLITTLMCAVNLAKMPKVISAVCACGFISCIAAAVSINVIAGGAAGTLIVFQNGIGLYVCAAAFAATFAVNFLIARKGIQVVYNEGIPERVEIWHQVKSGKLNIDDLPQPVVETAETRAIDEEIMQQKMVLMAGAEEDAV